MKYNELPKNPVETTIKMIGCRWKILIIRELLTGTKRFNELKKSVKGITQKVLSSKLKELGQDGLLIREIISQKPAKVEYTLTDVGYSLRNVIESMHDWGKDYKKYTKLLEKMNTNF